MEKNKTFTRDARLPDGVKDVKFALPDDVVEKIENIDIQFDDVFRNLPDTPADKVRKLRPFVNSPQQAAKIMAFGGKDKRHVNLKTLAAMRFVYKIDINAAIDEFLKSS